MSLYLKATFFGDLARKLAPFSYTFCLFSGLCELEDERAVLAGKKDCWVDPNIEWYIPGKYDDGM